MKMITTALAFLSVLTFCACPLQGEKDKDRTSHLTLKSIRCGPLALYVALRVRGVEVDLNSVAARCACSDLGECSALQLKEVAQSYGFENAKVVKSDNVTDVLELEQIAVLFVARPPCGDRVDDTAGNHFITCIGLQKDNVILFEGDKSFLQTRQWLQKRWRGYALIFE